MDVATSNRSNLNAALLVAALLLLPLLYYTSVYRINNMNTLLAASMLHGQLYIETPGCAAVLDIVPHHGHCYLPFGPGPALISIPFALIFGVDFDPFFLVIIVGIGNLLLFWQLLAALRVRGGARLWLTALFFIGALYLPNTSFSGPWYNAHAFTTFGLLIVLLATVRRWWWLAGLGVALAFTTRPSAGFALVFPLILLLVWSANERWPRRQLAAAMGGLLVPVLIAALLLGWYNYARFDNPLETGITLANQSPRAAAALRDGLYGFRYVPTNLLSMALQPPFPVISMNGLTFPWLTADPYAGMGLLFTTPALLYLIFARLRNPLVAAALLATLFTLVALLLYFWNGATQFGARYALDFMPFLFVALIDGLRHVQRIPDDEAMLTLPRIFKVLAAYSIIVGIWGAFIFADSYKFVGQRLLSLIGVH